MLTRLPALALALLIGCSPSADPPPSAPNGWGGAPFVLWPPPVAGQGSAPADNPWVTGAALGQGSGGEASPATSSGGSTSNGSGPGASAGGALVASPTGSGGTSAEISPMAPARLRFRAYVESTSSFKGVLVEHVSGGSASECTVELYSNGSTEVWRALDVPAGLQSGERALLCVPDGASTTCTVGFGGSVFNGNDALVLRCQGEALDSIGVVGIDPGKGWTGPGRDGQPASTVDSGLWRCGGDEESPSFDLAEWTAWNWEEDPEWRGPDCQAPGLGGAGAL